MSSYHHDIAIKQARIKLKMTQAHLATLRPSEPGGIGVGVGFVHLVESGQKNVTSSSTLRGLCDILHIEHWRFGLSEYDPFNPDTLPKGKRLVDQTLEVADRWILRIEYLYRTASLPVATQDVRTLDTLFEFIKTHQPPPIQQEKQFLRLCTQVQSLDGIIELGYGRYEQAFKAFEEMYETAKQLGEPSWLAHAVVAVGLELERAGKKGEAVEYLEYARDLSFETSKHVATYVHAYLARIYGSAGDDYRFERAINTALNLAPDSYGDGTDFVFHRLSSILAEKSYGFLDLGQPEKTLAMREEIEEQIKKDNNNRLAAWIPWDWAKAYKMQGKIEESVKEGRNFYTGAQTMQSPHIISRARHFATELMKDYKDVQVVKDFHEEVNTGGAQSDSVQKI